MDGKWFAPSPDGEPPAGIGRNLILYAVFFVLALAVLAAFFWPVVDLRYAYSDDWHFWAYEDRSDLTAFPQHRFIVGSGRFLFTYVLGLYGKGIHTLDDMGPMRGCTVVLVALVAAGLAMWLRRLGVGAVPALLISVAVFLLPGAQTYVSWIMGAPMVVSLLAATISAALAQRVCLRNMKRGLRRAAREMAFLLLSLAFLIASLFLYQATAMFFLVFPLCRILFQHRSRWPQTWRSAGRDITVFGLGCGLYFLLQRCLIMPFYFARHPELKEAFASNPKWAFSVIGLSRVPARLAWFVEDLSTRAFNLWHCHKSVALALAVLLFIVLGCVVAAVKGAKNSKAQGRRRLFVGYYLPCVVIVVVLLLAANAPLLMARGLEGHLYSRPLARTILPYSAMLVLLVAWALLRIASLLPSAARAAIPTVVLGAMVLTGGLSAERNLLKYGNEQVLEIRFLRARVVPYVKAGGGSIHVIRQKWLVTDPPLLDEFVFPTTIYWFDMPLLIKGALESDGGVTSRLRISTSYCGHPYEIPPGTLVVDMDNLFTPSSAKPAPATLVRAGYKGFNIYRIDDVFGRNYFAVPGKECGGITDSIEWGFSRMYVGGTEDEALKLIDNPPAASQALSSPSAFKAEWILMAR